MEHEPEKVVLDLIALLDEKRQEIAVAWVDVIRREMAGTYYGGRPSEEILENNLLCVDLLKDLLRGGYSLPRGWHDLQQLSHYLQEGLPVSEIMTAAQLIRQVLDPLVAAAFPACAPCRSEAKLRLDAALDRFAMLVVEFIASQVTEYLAEQHRRTGLMLDMARAVSANLDLEHVLRETAEGLAAAVGARHALIALIGEDSASVMIGALAGEFPAPAALALGEAMKGPIPLQDTAFLRPVIESKRPLTVPDVQGNPPSVINAYVRHTRSVLGVPIMLKEQVLGVAMISTHDAPRTFTQAEVELAQGIANVVAPAIENARLHRQVAQMAIVEERARLAQEIHDDLAQTLGAMQFYASLIGDHLARQEMTQAQAGMAVLHDVIDQAYVDVREAIFNLRSMASLQGGGLAALEDYLKRYSQHYGLAVHLQADEEAAGMLAGETGLQVYRILQEALANVRKHSETAMARVDVERQGPWVSMTIQDDGPGFDPTSLRDRDQEPPRFGLQIMRERAEKVGGTLSVESQPGRGTRVVLRVPYPERRGIA